MALPPTELDTWDVEDDIVASELALERHLAMCEVRCTKAWAGLLGVHVCLCVCWHSRAQAQGHQLPSCPLRFHPRPGLLQLRSPSAYAPPTPTSRQGLDSEVVDALLSVVRQEQQAHPGYLGGKGRPSQQLRQSTPPAGLSAEATEGVQQASLALFQRLGLRDYAQFSGWVLPQRPEQDDRLAAQLAAQQAAQQAEQQQQRQRGKSFAELAALDAELRAGLEAAATSISAADRAAAVDTTAGSADASGSEEEEEASSSGEEAAGSADAEPSLLNQLLADELQRAEAEAEAEGAALAELERNYGEYNGITIDGTYRLTPDQAMEMMAPHQR